MTRKREPSARLNVTTKRLPKETPEQISIGKNPFGDLQVIGTSRVVEDVSSEDLRQPPAGISARQYGVADPIGVDHDGTELFENVRNRALPRGDATEQTNHDGRAVHRRCHNPRWRCRTEKSRGQNEIGTRRSQGR